MEGIRMAGTFGSYREATTSMTVDDGGRKVSIKAGDRVFVSFVRTLFVLLLPLSQPYRILGRRSSQPGCFPLAERSAARPTFRLLHSLRRRPARLSGQRRQPRIYHGHDEGGWAFGQPQASTRSARPTQKDSASRRLLYLHETRSIPDVAFSNQ